MKEKVSNEKPFGLIYPSGLPRPIAKILMLIKKALTNPWAPRRLYPSGGARLQ
jgi:hypothetical protein